MQVALEAQIPKKTGFRPLSPVCPVLDYPLFTRTRRPASNVVVCSVYPIDPKLAEDDCSCRKRAPKNSLNRD